MNKKSNLLVINYHREPYQLYHSIKKFKGHGKEITSYQEIWGLIKTKEDRTYCYILLIVFNSLGTWVQGFQDTYKLTQKLRLYITRTG